VKRFWIGLLVLGLLLLAVMPLLAEGVDIVKGGGG
jgi:hypothetical protein